MRGRKGKHSGNRRDKEIDEKKLDLKLTAICELISTKGIIANILKTIMPRIWNLEDRVEIGCIGKNLFTCNFQSEKEKRRITSGGPWSFDKGLILFEEPKRTSKISDLDFG